MFEKYRSFADRLSIWLKTEANRPRKQKRTVKQLHADLLNLVATGLCSRNHAAIFSFIAGVPSQGTYLAVRCLRSIATALRNHVGPLYY